MSAPGGAPRDEKPLLADLPKVDELLALLAQRADMHPIRREIAKEMCRAFVAELRADIRAGRLTALPSPVQAAGRLAASIDELHRPRLRRIVNATGIVLHTNLGRAPLSVAAASRIAAVAQGYCNLEYDLERGQRGERYDHVRQLLKLLTGAEDALVVNNNAGAVLLVLDTLTSGREVVVSRGELIEIGGQFRIPDIMGKSGAVLREVGTTNRTHLADYEQAIGERTALILKVHTSNYRIVGFTAAVALRELVALGRQHGVPVCSDLGSGCLLDLSRYGLAKEPTVREVLETGVDVVTFSGDKLLGGPQAGLILGSAAILQRIKRNPLARALRIDKFTLAGLEATLQQYLQPDEDFVAPPSLQALTEPITAVARRARRLLARLRAVAPAGMSFTLRRGTSLAGGGALPLQEIATVHVAVRSTTLSVNHLEERLRRLPVPIVARIAADELLLDVRTIAADELSLIAAGFRVLAAEAA